MKAAIFFHQVFDVNFIFLFHSTYSAQTPYFVSAIVLRQIQDELIISCRQYNFNVQTGCSAGASPRPTYAWQAEHPAVHRIRLTGQLPRPPKIQQLADRNDLPVAVCYFSDKDIMLLRRYFFQLFMIDSLRRIISGAYFFLRLASIRLWMG